MMTNIPGRIQLPFNSRNESILLEKIKEITLSKSSTLGFNHYEISCLDPTLNEIDKFLCTTQLTIGFSPTFWRNITDLQILKKIVVFHVDKMKCIQLMDEEFNMANKYLGR